MASVETYFRPLSVKDLDECTAIETTAFPPNEAASREKIEYRLSACPELSYGLFAKASSPDGEDTLIGHVLSTMSTTPTVKDEDMELPPGGHRPEGKTIALHALAVAPAHQRSGWGKKLMKAYIEHQRSVSGADRISILAHDYLVPYYQSLGFKDLGKSKSEYAGEAWHDLACEFKS